MEPLEPLEPPDPECLGPYRLLARLGAGGMGRVYLARSASGRAVAVKAVRPELADDPTFRSRFRREVAAARSVGGDHTAPVVDADPEASTPWLATAYVLGPTLSDGVREFGPLPRESIWVLGDGLARALEAVHAAGIVHRDLKPSNVLLAAEGPRVIDFGIARAIDSTEFTRSGVVMGSPGYMSPEQATAGLPGPRSDVFSLGSVLVFAATGRPPFHGSSAATLFYQLVHGEPDLTGLPEPLGRIVSACLAKTREHRPSPHRLCEMFAAIGAKRPLRSGWLPPDLASAIARHATIVMDLDMPLHSMAGVSARPGAPSTTSGQPWQPPVRGAELLAWPPADVLVSRGDGPDARLGGGRAGRRGARRGAKPGVSRRGLIAIAGTGAATAVAGTAWLALERGRGAGSHLSPAPKPLWSYHGGVLVPAPAAFHDGMALVKSQAGALIGLSLADGARPRWTYEGISQSATPALNMAGAVVALGNGATVVGVDPDTGETRFSLDFGARFRFDRILGSPDDHTVVIEGLQFATAGGGQGTSTVSTNVIFSTDLKSRTARIVTISSVDTTIALQPVIVPGYFVYADGLRNVTARSTTTSGKLWSHRVGYDLAPRLLLLDSTVFAAGEQLIALDLPTGRVRWQVTSVHGAFASLGGRGRTVYCTDASAAGVHAFDAVSGTRLWYCPTRPLDASAPVVATAGSVFVTAADNTDGFYAISADRGRALWHFTDGRDTGQNAWQLSTDGSGHLIAQHFDTVYCLPVA
jgi:outer membrane protein assembly factor BamB